MKAELLKILREAEDYVSGQQLCDHFGVSRTAVWKVIRQLQEEGYQIEAVKNRGYLLKKRCRAGCDDSSGNYKPSAFQMDGKKLYLSGDSGFHE